MPGLLKNGNTFGNIARKRPCRGRLNPCPSLSKPRQNPPPIRDRGSTPLASTFWNFTSKSGFLGRARRAIWQQFWQQVAGRRGCRRGRTLVCEVSSPGHLSRSDKAIIRPSCLSSDQAEMSLHSCEHMAFSRPQMRRGKVTACDVRLFAQALTMGLGKLQKRAASLRRRRVRPRRTLPPALFHLANSGRLPR